MPIINGYRIDFSTTLTKFWIIDTFEIRAYEGNEGLKLLPPPSVIPPLYKCHAKRLTLRDLEISYADFKFLSLNAEDILLFHILVVNNEDGSIIPMEKIIQSLPKVEHLTM
uniref:Uncharacterized protein n=1 Tax=Panagrolaimus superbus TaxID=310955 RepID=A0A914XTK7_9BILA